MGEWPASSQRARVQRGPSGLLCLSWREWPRLPFTARIERAHSYRARSASKKGTWPLPPHSSKAARCANTLLFLFPPSHGVGACQLSPCGRRSRPFRGRALRDHSPYSLRSWAEWFPHCARRTILSLPHPLNNGLRWFCSQLRACNEGLLRPRVVRAKRANRLSPSPPTHDDESATTHPRCARRDSWLVPAPAEVHRIVGW